MNPFGIKYNHNTFCDRENELKQLKENIDNSFNTLVHSPRRIGKTALIQHLFYHLESEKKCETIYVDLFATSDINGLIRLLSEKILAKYHKKNLLEGISKVLKGMKTTVSFSTDGTPQFSLSIGELEYGKTLDQLFGFLEKRKKKIIIAFDEFQEIGKYPEKAEAILQTHIQPLKNVLFIFSGSSTHLLSEMFLNAKKPFYQSSEVVVLNNIEKTVYSAFISQMFESHKKKIEQDAVEYILDFTRGYTYYTQVICTLVYARTVRIAKLEDTKQLVEQYLDSRKPDYSNLLSLLSENQKKVLKAISKENIVSMPTKIEFLMKYSLPSVSSVSLAIKTLVDKEIIYKNIEGYFVYDVFFSRFLEKYF